MNFLSVGLAILAAFSNATSNVLQRTVNRDEPAELALSPRLILGLLHHKVWLAGLATVTLSFILQAAALANGDLSLVQPIVVLELPLTLLLASLVYHQSLHRREWGAIALMTVGLGVLVASLVPNGGDPNHVKALVWVIGVGACAAVVVSLVALGRRAEGNHRAGLFGIATGICFGLTAAFMKAATTHFSGGVTGLLSSWPIYATVTAGLVGMFLMQNALQAGNLVAAQPGITLLDPVVGIIWGVVIFGEQTRAGLFIIAAVLGAAAVAVGAVLLAHSPLLEVATDLTDSDVNDSVGDGANTGADKTDGRSGQSPGAVTLGST